MNTKTFITLLQHPDNLEDDQLFELEKVIETYPFFQAPKALYLKGLKNQGSYRYNTELRNTAAYTTDRHVLFDFITSEVFRKTQETPVSSPIVEKKQIEDVTFLSPEALPSESSVSLDTVVTMKMHEADEVLDPELFVAAEEKIEEKTEEIKIEKEPSTPEVMLQPDQPLEFDQNELHSFGEWMKLASLQPIDRGEESVDELHKAGDKPEEKTSDLDDKSLGLADKYRMIDDFIAKNPKIGPVSNTAISQNLAKQKKSVPDTLMTETLAKVYLAQKNYKKAIQAYNILILKNPEKSGFFADQIRAIKKLHDHK